MPVRVAASVSQSLMEVFIMNILVSKSPAAAVAALLFVLTHLADSTMDGLGKNFMGH
jgi:hypothetical protein